VNMTIWENFLAVIGGIGGLFTLVGVIWRLLRSGEFISEREYFVMRIVTLGGFGLMVLAMILLRK